MKYSIFNTYIPISSDKLLVYNSLSDGFAALYGSFSNNTENLPPCHLLNTSYLDSLISIGAVIENDEIDEVAQLQEIIDKCDADRTHIQLHINPTLDCNFNCWYCYENHIKGSIMNDTTIEAVKKHITAKIESNPDISSFHLSFFGGEPLLAYNNVVRPVVEYTSEICKESDVQFSVSFTTNGFLVNQEIIDFLKSFEYTMQITLDGGREFHNKTRFPKGGSDSFDTILENITKIASSGGHIILRINYTSQNIDSALDVVDILKASDKKVLENINVDMQRVWQDRDNVPVDESEVADSVRKIASGFEVLGLRCVTTGTRDRVGQGCYGDKDEYALINFNGDVYKCTARDFTEKNRCGVLLEDGKIKWDEEQIALRRKIKFSREECRKCRIAPICFGGCRQSAIERKEIKGCVRGYSSEDIDRIVMDRFIAANKIN